MDASATPDADGRYDPCAPSAVVDLNARGTRSGDTTRIVWSNATTPSVGPLWAPCLDDNSERSTSGQVVFRYTPAATALLLVSTDGAETAPDFDTVLWAQSACVPLFQSTRGVIGCDDDSAPAPRDRASRFLTTSTVTAGASVYIVVAGLTRAPVAAGRFELSVTEMAAGAPGTPCFEGAPTNPCAPGSTCIGRPGAGAQCVANGTASGACRTEGAACDAGLTCSQVTLTRCPSLHQLGRPCSRFTVGRCVPAHAPGGACDRFGEADACVPGARCLPGDGGAVCVAEGARGGDCRAADPRCDGALTCSAAMDGLCRAAAAVGGACDVAARETACVGGTCVPAMTGGSGVCAAPGTAAGASCREAEPRCDEGLSCNPTGGPAVCQRVAAAGAACTPGVRFDACAPGTACLPTSASAGTCARPLAEVEPNGPSDETQVVAGAQALIAGSVTQGDRDCFRVTAPMGMGAGSWLFLETNAPASAVCPSMQEAVSLNVSAVSGRVVNAFRPSGEHGACVRASGETAPELRHLTAGEAYDVCVLAGSPLDYLLTIAFYPAPP